jgi:MFS transporter, DHA1 family, tetracycline resistance protein
MTAPDVSDDAPDDPADQQIAPGPTGLPMTAPRKAMLVVFIVVFIDLLGFGIVLPVMPRQVEPYLGTSGLDLSPAAKGVVIGVLFSVFSLMQFVFSPVWGRVSDRIGRRPVLLISLLGSVVFYALYGFAVTLPAGSAALAVGLMLAARVGAGIAGASVGTAAAVIADCTPPDRRAKGMALIGIAFGIGFTFGPLIAYFGLAAFDQQPWGVGALASGLSLVALLLAAAVFKETRDPANKAGKEFFSLARTAEVLRMPTVGALVLIYFLAICAFANLEATLALLTEVAFGMSVEDNFLVFAFVGAVLTLAGGFYRPLAKRGAEHRLLAVGLALMVAGLAGLGAVAWAATQFDPAGGLKPLFYAAVSVAVVGFAFVNPSVSALVSKRADPARQGEVLGVNQAFASLGRILGPFLGSVLFQADPNRVAPYALAVALLLLVAALLPRVRAS